MKDNRSDKVKQICSDNIELDLGCINCPLSKPCQPTKDDSKEAFDIRMNAAAEELAE